MRTSIPKSIIRTIQRAVIEFDLVESGDNILIGLSGGKDSLLMLYAFSVFTKHLPFPVKIAALTVDMGFDPENQNSFGPLKDICNNLEVPYEIVQAELADEILNNPTQNPCARCSYMRRAIIHNYAKDHGFNKVAFAHHYDDAVETFLMSIIYSGQITTFLPKTYLDRTGITVIRPLVYLRESDIKRVVKKLGITPIASSCPVNEVTKRAEVKDLIRNLKKDNLNVFSHLAAAMRQGRHIQLWPRELTKIEIREKSNKFWDKSRFDENKESDQRNNPDI